MVVDLAEGAPCSYARDVRHAPLAALEWLYYSEYTHCFMLRDQVVQQGACCRRCSSPGGACSSSRGARAPRARAPVRIE